MVTWGHDYRLDRAELAKKLAAEALAQDRSALAARFNGHAKRYWQEASEDFNSTYSAWCD